jgi:hypothetical protein
MLLVFDSRPPTAGSGEAMTCWSQEYSEIKELPSFTCVLCANMVHHG